jgi:hypothetical protein
MFLIAAFAAAISVAAAAQAAEPAGYELDGFPITRHQVAVMGASNVREQSPVPTLMLGGMPASPSQMAILSPRQITTSTTIRVEPITAELVAK